MVSFPNAKINFGLNITAKRSDGFHDIETVFFPIHIQDVLEIIISYNKTVDVDFSSSGLTIAVNTESNLCVKAYQLLKKDFELPSIKVHLHKTIPMGAGLGGGSADAAFTLKLINDAFSLKLNNNQLIQYALQLGSDCPFFIINKTCFATSRGENLIEIPLNLNNYQLAIINPQIHISTAWAFSKISPKQQKISLKEAIKQPIETWKQNITNDFETPIFKEYPTIKIIKETLYNNKAIFAAMTGTGSTVFGIFEKNIIPFDFNFPKEYFVKWINL